MGHLFARLRDRYVDWRYGRIDLEAAIGPRGEQAAARFLRRKGLVIVGQGESDRGGEIDLIAIDPKDRRVIFVEVKTTASTKPGHPADRVTPEKQARIARASLRYMKRKKILGAAARFDVVAVWWSSGGPRPDRIEHYEAAFESPLEGQMF